MIVDKVNIAEWHSRLSLSSISVMKKIIKSGLIADIMKITEKHFDDFISSLCEIFVFYSFIILLCIFILILFDYLFFVNILL